MYTEKKTNTIFYLADATKCAWNRSE